MMGATISTETLMERYLFPLFLSSNEYQLVHNMSVVMCICGFILFVAMGFVQSPVGRYSKKCLGFRINRKLSWMLQVLPSFVAPFVLLYTTNCVMFGVSYPNRILLSLFILHYFHRTFFFPFMLRGIKPTPVLIFLGNLIFCTYNGFLQSYFLTNIALYPVSWTKDFRFVGGVLIFFIGMSINLHSDFLLRQLRKPGEIHYKIPHGGVFEFVSGANLLGEIIEWWGYAIAGWSFPMISFALFSTLYLGWRACHHHIFYLEKFEDYPKSRKALIPFVL